MFNYKYDFSIVMAYYNRKKQIINTLNDFKKYNYSFEVIIIDDDSDNENKLDDILQNYKFPIKYKLNKKMKDIINPCVVYNKGFNLIEGRITIIQNPECFHVGNILNYIENHLTLDNYLIFSCFNNIHPNETEIFVKNPEMVYNEELNIGETRWYIHPDFNNRKLHFCSAIMTDNLKILGGFNEIFKHGIDYDDDSLILDIHNILKLDSQIVHPAENVFVIHQYHKKFNYLLDNKLKVKELQQLNKKLYNEFKKSYEELINFPRILHLYWDNNKLSFLNLLTIISFNKYNINWKINIYISNNINSELKWASHEHKIKYDGIDYFNSLKKINNVNIIYFDFNNITDNKDILNASEVVKSDYFRYYILNKFGGVWSDFDILYTKNINNYINKSKNSIFYKYYDAKKKNIYPVGFLCSNKNKLNFILSDIGKYYDSNKYETFGNGLLIKLFNKNTINNNSIYIDNADLYLPLKWNEMDNILKKNYFIDSEYFGIHWFNGLTMLKKYSENINSHIDSDFNNFFINEIRKYREYL